LKSTLAPAGREELRLGPSSVDDCHASGSRALYTLGKAIIHFASLHLLLSYLSLSLFFLVNIYRRVQWLVNIVDSSLIFH
jgi:hypothetical protein